MQIYSANIMQIQSRHIFYDQANIKKIHLIKYTKTLQNGIPNVFLEIVKKWRKMNVLHKPLLFGFIWSFKKRKKESYNGATFFLVYISIFPFVDCSHNTSSVPTTTHYPKCIPRVWHCVRNYMLEMWGEINESFIKRDVRSGSATFNEYR